MESDMESDTGMSQKVVCEKFIPQQWRKTKCKLCFNNITEHKNISKKQQSEEFTRNNSVTPADELCYSPSPTLPHSNYTTGSSDRIDDDNEEDTSCSSNLKFGEKDSENEDDETRCRKRKNTLKGKNLPSHFGYEQQDSIDIEEGSNSPRTNKRRGRSYYKRDSNLLQFSAMMRSSNSSLCSFTSEYNTDGYSDYDFDIRSITDDTDDYTEMNDVIDELENIKPELKARVQNERRISRSKILDLERELEGQIDHHRASEVAKERQILAYQREIEGLKLELSSVKAYENIMALKSRLELEGKSSRCNDLEEQVENLQDEISKLKSNPEDSLTETQQDDLNRNLDRAEKTILSLVEENKALQEKINLAEDLKKNDRELVAFLRNQLESLENDLVSSRENSRLLEDSLKMMEVSRTDYEKEQEKCAKLSKELESIRQKVKRRDRHIEDLEDDNVKLQQQNKELDSQLSKRDFKMKKMERRVSELQSSVTKCNKEIADLTGEKKTFEQVRKLTDLKLKDLQGDSGDTSTSEVENGKNIFIYTLEERLRHSESRAKELQLENNTFQKEIQEICENLNTSEIQTEEYKDLLKESEKKYSKTKEELKHKEKKNEWLQRKLHKSDQEKKRAINRQNDAENKLTQYQGQCLLNTDIGNQVSNQDSIDENDTRMLKLKLQSTEAKLSMIEGNKGYLETKVKSLERKVRDKEFEVNRLLDSMERDSGAPSQEYDRSDGLDRENVLLQSKVDELALENMEQKQLVNQLEENNTHLEATIKNLNEKMGICTARLKQLEDDNHKLGWEAFKLTQSITGMQGDDSLNELRSHNKILQDKMKDYNSLEEIVEELSNNIKKEKGNIQWYSDENEKLKIKIMKLSQNIQSVESSKREFEKSIHHLQDVNKELDADVKRLEQKLEIYADLFGKDSKLSSSLRRRSYQSDDERDEERMLENALAPLMEEIKEKDSQIRSMQAAMEEQSSRIKSLHEKMEEKNATIDLLSSEIGQLEANLAAIVTEKIKKLHISGDSSDENEQSEEDTSMSNNTSTYQQHMHFNNCRKLEQISTGNIPLMNICVDQPGHISPELIIRRENKYLEENEGFECKESGENNITEALIDDELTVTTDVFYDILHERQKSLEKKDLEYFRKIIDGAESPTENKFYKTIERALDDAESPNEDMFFKTIEKALDEDKFYKKIESALLDHYREDGSPTYTLPSLSDVPIKNLKKAEGNVPGNIVVDDMYDQLDELECIVNIKPKPPQVSPKENDAKIGSEFNDVINDETNDEKNDDDNSNGNDLLLPSFIPSVLLGKKKSESKEYPSKGGNVIGEKGVDLSGLDDLLAEVNRRGTEYSEQVVKKKELQERRSLPHSSSTPKVVVPSIRTTKRKIIRLGELNRSESCDSTSTW